MLPVQTWDEREQEAEATEFGEQARDAGIAGGENTRPLLEMTTETCNLGFEDLDCQSLSSKNAGPRCLNSLVLVGCFAAWPGGSFGTQLCPSRRIAEHGVSCFLISLDIFELHPLSLERK